MNENAIYLKSLIKKLSAEQGQLKPLRKTGTYVCDWTSWTFSSKAPDIVKSALRAAYLVRENKQQITAALNLYHEARGSSHRHGVSDQDKYLYRHWENKIKEMIVGKAL